MTPVAGPSAGRSLKNASGGSATQLPPFDVQMLEDGRFVPTTVPGERLGWYRVHGKAWRHSITGEWRQVHGDKLVFAVLPGMTDADLDEMAKTGGRRAEFTHYTGHEILTVQSDPPG